MFNDASSSGGGNGFDVLIKFLGDNSDAVNSVKDIQDAVNGLNTGSTAGASPVGDIQSQINALNDLVAARQADVVAARQQVMEWRTMQRVGSVLTNIGTTFFVPAAAVLAAANKAASDWVDNLGKGTELANEWNQATASLSNSEQKVGETVAQIELPALQEAAKLADDISSFAQAHPEVISDILGFAAGLAGVSALVMVAGKILTVYAELNYIGSAFQLMAAETALAEATSAQTVATIANTAALGGETITGIGAGAAGAATGEGITGIGAGAAGAATVGVSGLIDTIAPIVIPLAAAWLGGQGYNALKPANAPSALQVGPELGADIYAAEKPFLDKLGPFGQSIEKFDQSILGFELKMTGVNSPFGGTETSEKDITATQLTQGETEWENHLKKLNDIQTTYDKDMEDQQTSYDASLEDLNESYANTTQKEQQQYYATEADDQKTYEDQVADETAKFYQSQADAQVKFDMDEAYEQEQYQNKMADLAQSHQDTLQDLTENHDWLGMAKEDQKYNQEKDRDERDYAEADAKRIADFNLQQSEAQRNFNEQQAEEAQNFANSEAKRLAAFQQQQQDEYNNYQDSLQKLILDNKNKIAQIKQNDADQNTQEETDYQTKMDTILDIANAGENQIVNSYYQMLRNLGYSNVPANLPIPTVQTNLPTHDTGGYWGPGVSANRTGENEWVMAPSTVKYAETIVGGRLNQSNLLAALMSGRSGGNITNNMSGLTAQDRLLVGSMVTNAVRKQMKQEFAK